MPLRTITIDGKTYAEVENGKVVYINTSGNKIVYDGEELAATVARLNGDLKDAQGKLGAFDGIDDPEAARKALATVKNLDDKKLVEAGQVETIKAAAIKAVEDRYKPIEAERDQLRTALHKEMIGGRFERSKYIAEKMTLPAQMVEATFGSHFTVEDGRVVARTVGGYEIFSPSNPGERADFEEALEVLVTTSPFSDQIIKGANKNGDNANPGAGTGENVVTRAEYDAMMKKDPARTHKFIADGGKVVE